LPKVWDVYPLRVALVEAMQKKQGVSTDVELLDLLRQNYEDLSFKEMNMLLMKLEVEGMISVTSLTKTKRRVELKGFKAEEKP
jgi:hypothetical protein